MRTLKIDDKFPPMYRRPERAYFSIDDSGLMLIYNYRMPTEKELSAVKEGNPAEFRFLVENGMIFFMSKMGSLPWNDSPFDPRLDRDHGLEPPVSENDGYLMMFMMIDAATNTIKHIRKIELGHDFSFKLCDAVNEFYDREENSQIESVDALQKISEARIDTIHEKFTSDELAKRATVSYRIKRT